MENLNQNKFKKKEGNEQKILFFPAKLQHCVYPFFKSNETRITISGNIN
jgi:hypothetical protein